MKHLTIVDNFLPNGGRTIEFSQAVSWPRYNNNKKSNNELLESQIRDNPCENWVWCTLGRTRHKVQWLGRQMAKTHTEWPSTTEWPQTSARLACCRFLSFSFFPSNLFSSCIPFYKCAHSLQDVQASCGDVRHDILLCPAHLRKHNQASCKNLYPKILPQSDDADPRQLHCFSTVSSAQLFTYSNALDCIQ